MKIIQDNQEREYVFVSANYSVQPDVMFSVMFDVYINQKRVWSYQVVLCGCKAQEFYDNWVTHEQVYNLLIKELQVNE